MKKLILLSALFALAMVGCSKNDKDGYDSWDRDVVAPKLEGITAVNLDNSGLYPEELSNTSKVKKEAYVIGIKWILEHLAGNDNDVVVIGRPNQYPSYGYKGSGSVVSNYETRITAMTQFSSKIGAGANISGFFAYMDDKSLPENIDEGYVLFIDPLPGDHYFKIEYLNGNKVVVFQCETSMITFY